jgi:hypothetical protein
MVPISELEYRFSNSNCFMAVISGGIVPVKWFDDRSRSDRMDMLQMDGGMVPERKLLERIKDPVLTRFPRSEGIVPLNWLEDKSTKNNPAILPIDAGMGPRMRFFDRSSVFNCVTDVNEGDMVPPRKFEETRTISNRVDQICGSSHERRLELTSNWMRFENAESWDGMQPVRRLLDNSRAVSEERRLNESGIDPENKFPPRSRR